VIKLKIITIIGARPQFIKAAPISQALKHNHDEVIVHTGQHYDEDMSNIFFSELNIPKPIYNLGVGSGTHAYQTAHMMLKIEEIILNEKPDCVLVYGDTNSTLAGAISAAKIGIPVIHMEAGLRSYNKKMPEEINRVLTDYLSSVLFCPTQNAVSCLKKENITENIYNIGDVMLDATIKFKDLALEKYPTFPSDLQYINKKVNIDDYYLCTIHRAENTDIDKLKIIISSLEELEHKVLIPAHPRTRQMILSLLKNETNIVIVKPVGYLQMLKLIIDSILVITDSGGLQKEAYYLKKRCVTVREETEWIETLNGNWNILTKIDNKSIIDAVKNAKIDFGSYSLSQFGDGSSAKKFVKIMEEIFNEQK